MKNTAAFELTPELKNRISELAKTFGRSKSWIAREAFAIALPVIERYEQRPRHTKEPTNAHTE